MIQETHNISQVTPAGTGMSMVMQQMNLTSSSSATNHGTYLELQTTPPTQIQAIYSPEQPFYAYAQLQVDSAYHATTAMNMQQVYNVNQNVSDAQLIELEDCLFSLESHQAASTGASLKKEAVNLSDASTVEDDATDEAIAYLQGLNSGNLMQCSQQSVVQELLNKESLEMKAQAIADLFHKVSEEENADLKPNLDSLPTFEEHDIAGYKFQLNPRNYRNGKICGTFSEKLNKIYVRRNEIFCIEAVYTPKNPPQALRVRAMLCFSREVSEPVVRCPNHMSQETEVSNIKTHSFMRCENPSVEYCGTAYGKGINDRYSVLIPLNAGSKKNSGNPIKETIALKFTCQNSCIGRKETSIIFLLEGSNGEVLAERVVDVKICSCPKRDRGLDERAVNGVRCKRKNADETNCAPPPKLLKQESSGLKLERSVSDFDEKFDVQMTSNGEVSMKLHVSSKTVAMNAIHYVRSLEAYELMYASDDSKLKPRQTRILRRIRRLYEKLEKI